MTVPTCRGCGCDHHLTTEGCVQCKRRHESRAKRLRLGMTPRVLSEVPIEPIRRELRAYLDRSGEPVALSQRERMILAGAADLGVLIWPHKSRETARNRLEALLYKQKTVTFDLADRILTALDREHLWYCDPVLAEAYQRVVFTEREEAA